MRKKKFIIGIAATTCILVVLITVFVLHKMNNKVSASQTEQTYLIDDTAISNNPLSSPEEKSFTPTEE